MPELITSPSNPKIKRLLALQQKSSARREAGLFVVEGRRELQHCIDAGFEVDTIFLCPSLCNAPQGGQMPSEKVFEVSEVVYAKIAMREGTEGVIAEVKTPERRLEDLQLPQRPLVVAL